MRYSKNDLFIRLECKTETSEKYWEIRRDIDLGFFAQWGYRKIRSCYDPSTNSKSIDYSNIRKKIREKLMKGYEIIEGTASAEAQEMLEKIYNKGLSKRTPTREAKKKAPIAKAPVNFLDLLKEA